MVFYGEQKENIEIDRAGIEPLVKDDHFISEYIVLKHG